MIIMSYYLFINYYMLQKCPYCKRNILSVELKDIDVKIAMKSAWRGVSYVCPHWDCNSILSVAIDPIALKSDIVNELFNKLRNQ